MEFPKIKFPKIKFPKFKLLEKKHPIIKMLMIFVSICIVIIVITLSVLTISAYKEDLSILSEPLPKALLIMDMDGEVVSEISSSKFTSVELTEIPDILVAAIVAVEDKRFYSHSGVDISGIGRSIFRNIGAGHIVGGGSTITQQLAKNIFLSSDQTYTRKFKEAIIALRIEKRYDKDEILELYLNQIYFGEGKWGVQDAAMVYFGKNIQDINISEAALLAALPKAPTSYSPFKNMEKAIERRNLVLNLLFDQDIISKDELEESVSGDIILGIGEQKSLSGEFPSYVDYVIEEAINKYGFSEEDILKGGLNIYTQMDPVVQKSIEAAYAVDELFPTSSGEEIIQSGSVVIDPKTGGVRGLVGYRGKYYYGGFNRATQLKRQPGSAIKPLVVYAPALESGYKPNSMIEDKKTNFDGYTPTNVDNIYKGSVSLYDALVHSINLPAVFLLNEIGLGTGIEFLEKAGIKLNENDRNLSIALGGFTEGVSPLEMAQAFSIFPNLGSMKKAHVITEITSSDGKVLLEVKEEEVEVMKAENAYTMTKILMGVVEEGTGKNALLNRPTAGKTGTTELPLTDEFKGISGVRDAWFVGYTPELVTAVWVGYDKNNPNFVMQSSGGNHPAKIFNAIMSSALENVKISSFEIPKNYKEEEKDKSKENKKKDSDKKKKKGRDKK
ncbi:MAG: PBP1A family penicillin-binding protein [Acidaminobacteraceae bacterium]